MAALPLSYDNWITTQLLQSSAYSAQVALHECAHLAATRMSLKNNSAYMVSFLMRIFQSIPMPIPEGAVLYTSKCRRQL